MAQQVPADSAAARLYRRACGHMDRGHMDLAYEQLAEAFGYGLKSPMQVVIDSCFAPLLQDSLWRMRVHDLIRRHAWDSSTEMPSNTTGERVELLIRVRDADGEQVTGAVVDLTPDGPFASVRGNPAWFACLRTNGAGRVGVGLVWPESGSDRPVRFHLSVQHEGFVACEGMLEMREPGLADGSAQVTPAADSGQGTPTWVALFSPDCEGPRVFQAGIELRRKP